jgi:uncharacterized Zn finger protein
MGYGYYPRYVSVAEKKARAEKKIRQLRKKNPDIQPIILAGQALSTTWWGKAWNKNLEGYADYSNRIGRGRSYVRHGAVADLKIEPGLVTALVLGTRKSPYRVEIRIRKINRTNWQRISRKCQAELSSLPDLLAGKIPRKLQDVFMVQGKGLFPAPREISFDCSCPDWASMCKHVAATLYGVGARLDEDPSLFFTLRGVDMEELVGRAAQDRADVIISSRHDDDSRVIGDDKLADLFGIEMDDVQLPPISPSRKKPKGRSATAKRKTSSPAPKKKKVKKSKKVAAQAKKPAEPPLSADYAQASNLVLGCIEESGTEGISVRDLTDITAISKNRLYQILQRLKKQGLVHSPVRGKYSPVES